MNTYTLPNTDRQVVTVLPGVHVSPETAYVVDDYPFGFKLRCKIRYWLEYQPKKGFRLVSQTTNPKVRGAEVWNKPKASTYSRFGGAMFLDQDGHLQWTGMHEYMDTAQTVEWRDHFIEGVPEVGRKFAEAWVKAKLVYEERKAQLCDPNAAAHALRS